MARQTEASGTRSAAAPGKREFDPERAPPDCRGEPLVVRRCSRVAWASVGVACHGTQGGATCASLPQATGPLATARRQTTRGAGSLISAQQRVPGACACASARARADDLAGPGNPVRRLEPSADVTFPPPVLSTARARRRLPSPCPSRWPAPHMQSRRRPAVRLRSRAHAPAACSSYRGKSVTSSRSGIRR